MDARDAGESPAVAATEFMEAVRQIHHITESLLAMTPSDLAVMAPYKMSSREVERLCGCDFALGNYGIKRLS
jgi:hypothetical protein